jgi:hypothetical protein
MSGIRPQILPEAQQSYARMAAYNVSRDILPRKEHSQNYKGNTKDHGTYVEKLDAKTDPTFVPPSTQTKLLFNPYTHQVTGKPRKSKNCRDWTKYYILCNECNKYHANTKEPYFSALFGTVMDIYYDANGKPVADHVSYVDFLTKDWYEDKISRRKKFCNQHKIPFQIAPILKPFEVDYVQQHQYTPSQYRERLFKKLDPTSAAIRTFLRGNGWLIEYFSENNIKFNERYVWTKPPHLEPWQIRKLGTPNDGTGSETLTDWYSTNLYEMRSTSKLEMADVFDAAFH